MRRKACKKRRAVYVSTELFDLSLSTIFEVDESRLSKEDGVTSIPTCEHQSSYELKAERMNTRKTRWCKKILKELMGHNHGWIFNRPVDPVQIGIPDYFDVIRNPMDLGTIKKKLSSRQYVSTDEFVADVSLTFSNAMKYNPPGSAVHAIAKELNEIFDSKWESVKKKFRGPSLVQEQKTIFKRVHASMDSKLLVVRWPVACSSSITKKSQTDALSSKVKIISSTCSAEQLSSKGLQKDDVSSQVEHTQRS